LSFVGALAMLCIVAALAWPLRRTTLWPIALPIALTFAESGFVQEWGLLIRVPGFPVPLRWLDIVFGSLVVAWLLVRRLSPREIEAPVPLGVDVALLVAWLCVVAISLPLAWLDEGSVKLGISWTILPYLYIPLGAIVLYDMLQRSDRTAMWTLLRSLSVVVSVLAGFYVLHMLGRSIYDLAGINSTYWQQGEFRRDMLTFPVWACLTIPFLLWSERIGVVEGSMLVVQLAAVAVSSTRSLVLACGLAIAFVVAARIAARRRPFQPLVPVGIGITVYGLLAWLAPAFVARRTDAILSRFDELSGGGASVPNLVYRLGVGERVSSLLGNQALWTGVGFSDSAGYQARASLSGLTLGDSLWPVILLRFGVIGMTIVGFTLVAGVATGLVAAWRRRREPLSLAVVGAAALLWLAARTVASAEIFEFAPLALALPTALVMVEARDAWSTSSHVQPLWFGRGEGLPLFGASPRGRAFKLGLLALVVVAEIAVGWVVAR
jgi:hypothetical protein